MLKHHNYYDCQKYITAYISIRELVNPAKIMYTAVFIADDADANADELYCFVVLFVHIDSKKGNIPRKIINHNIHIYLPIPAKEQISPRVYANLVK